MGYPRCRGWLAGDTVKYLDPEQQPVFLAEAGAPLRRVLTSEDRHLTEWIPIDTLVAALVLADRIKGGGSYSHCWALGKFLSARESGAVQALAARVLRPSILMSLAPGLWSTHFQDAGRVSVRATGERALTVTLDGFPGPHRALCLAIGGWMEGWLALGPRRAIHVEHTTCRCRGSGSCDYAVSWED